MIGKSVRRVEDLPLLTGRGRFVENVRAPGVLHMAVVRSPFAHARIRRIDPEPALRVPGVVAVFGGRDLWQEWAGPLPVIWSVTPGANVPKHWPLAVEEARYAGDGVAVVVAQSLAAARDGAEAVRVDYEPLAAVVDVEAALEAGAPLVHPEFGTNRCFTLTLSSGEDADELFRRADVRLARTFRQQRLLPSPMEPRAVLAEALPGGDFLLWTSTQVPHLVKRTLGACVGIPEHRLRVVAPDVGGGFGAKLNVYPEEALALVLARRLDRPVRWVEDRSEEAVATTHGRGQVQHVEVAAARDGRLLAIRVSVLASMGAYLRLETAGIPIVGRFLFGGAYRARGYRYECTGVFTNQPPTGAYRGAGRPEATYAIERMMDLLAREVGLDPVEVRRRNFLPPGEGVENAAGIRYDSVDYERALDRALELAQYARWRDEQARRQRSGDPHRIGVGVAFYVDSSGIGPSGALAATRYESGGWEYARVRLNASGQIEVATGTSPHGQGHATAWAQLVGEVLGVGLEDVRVHHGDTAVVPMGTGTFGSRSLVVGGTAVYLASQRLVARARRIAAHLLEAAEQDVVFADGRFTVAGAPERTLSLAEVARAAYLARSLPEGVEPGLEESALFHPPDWTYPFGAHVAVVEVDEETGHVSILQYVAVDDCGSVVNPAIVDGQVHGGVAQGIGQALFEEVVFSEDGQLLNPWFTTYLVPSAAEVPELRLDRTVTPSPLNPLGAKGIGEAGTLAAPAAVMNAVHDAVGSTREIDMPAHPERVWRAFRNETTRGAEHAMVRPERA
jgi:carbon-monoxide dehydrogenase large subunit